MNVKVYTERFATIPIIEQPHGPVGPKAIGGIDFDSNGQVDYVETAKGSVNREPLLDLSKIRMLAIQSGKHLLEAKELLENQVVLQMQVMPNGYALVHENGVLTKSAELAGEYESAVLRAARRDLALKDCPGSQTDGKGAMTWGVDVVSQEFIIYRPV